MTKKIVWGVVLFGLIGILVAGAVVRTAAKAGEGIGAHGARNGGGTGEASIATTGAAGSALRAGSGDGTGTGQAQVDEWLTLEGLVVSADADALVMQITTGEQVVVENRPWSYVQMQGFAAQAGDRVTLTAFLEDGTIEVGQIADLTNGQAVQLRDENGRPMWAGRGQGNG